MKRFVVCAVLVLSAAPGFSGEPAAPAAREVPPRQVLGQWARRCPAIAAYLSSRGGSEKRGIGVSAHAPNGGTILSNLGVSWYYTWGTRSIGGGSAEFVPMIYGIGNGGSDVDKNLRELDQVRPLPRFVLAYNEPDLSQHISPTDRTWQNQYAPRLPAGAEAVGPAASHTGPWVTDFMKDQGDQFNHAAIHIYINTQDPNETVEALVARFDKALAEAQKEAQGKPLWVTEFGLATWKIHSAQELKFTDEKAACFMAQVLPMVESRAERYAWFSPGPDGKTPLYPTLPDALWNLDGSLTPLGELYRQ